LASAARYSASATSSDSEKDCGGAGSKEEASAAGEQEAELSQVSSSVCSASMAEGDDMGLLADLASTREGWQ
jgi:hypothetical protein